MCFKWGENMAKANIKVTFLCPVEKVWNTVTDLENYGWRSDIKKIRIVDDRNFEEYSKEGIVTSFQVTNKKECELWEFALENQNIKGKWTGRFYRYGDNTTLDFTEEVRAKKWFLMPFVGSYLRKQQMQYFVDLKKALGCEEASRVQIF